MQLLNESKAVKEEQKKAEEKKKKASNPIFVKNKYLASYFRLSTQLEQPEETEERGEQEVTQKGGKAAQNTHSAEVLNILNGGNLRELQILPQVGLKTAYQIMTFR